MDRIRFMKRFEACGCSLVNSTAAVPAPSAVTTSTTAAAVSSATSSSSSSSSSSTSSSSYVPSSAAPSTSTSASMPALLSHYPLSASIVLTASQLATYHSMTLNAQQNYVLR